MTALQLKKALQDGALDASLQALYPQDVPAQRERYLAAVEAFAALYGEEREVSVYSAAGRTEVGGNHTDHQRGRVLAASVDLDTIAVAAPRKDNAIRLKSEGYAPVELSLATLAPVDAEAGTTAALIRGVTAGFVSRGYATGGFDAYVTSSVPAGAGLSSSASFEVLIGSILSGLCNEGHISPVTLAVIGQEAENRFFKKPCGLMDQVACAVGGLVHIDFSGEDALVTPVRTDFSVFGHALCITATGGSHADLTDAYAAIPREMRAVAGCLGGTVLADVPEEAFLAAIPALREKTGDRAILRAMHWFRENRRVDAEKAALEAGDFRAFLSLIRESGRSSWELLQNIHPDGAREQGVALALAVSERILAGQGAFRVHGGGFAGTIQAFVPAALTDAYRQELDRVFGPGACHVLHIRSTPCGRVM